MELTKDFIVNNLMDIISSILALIAIIISVITWKKSDNSNKKITEKTLNQKFFEEIFFEYIVTKLPQILVKLEYVNGNATNECNEMQQLIEEIFDKAMFYKYFEEKFYNELKGVLIELDDKLVLASDPNISRASFQRYKEEISLLTNDFYRVLRKYYSGV